MMTIAATNDNQSNENLAEHDRTSLRASDYCFLSGHGAFLVSCSKAA